MPIGRSLLLVLLLASAGFGADTVRTLDGKELVGDITSISPKEIVIKVGGKDTPVPTDQVLLVEAGAAGKLPGGKYTDVELTDGTILHCAQIVFKGKEATLTLLSGQAVKVPMDIVNSFINDAQDEKIQAQWKEKLAIKKSTDLLVANVMDTLSVQKGTFGEASEDGKTIKFDLNNAGQSFDFELAKAQGIIFLRPLNPNLPSTVCTVHDGTTNVIAAAAVSVTPTGYTVTTPAGAKIEYTKKLVSRFDYNTGKLRFLSDMKPSKMVVNSTQGDPEPPRPDKNLDGGSLRLGKVSYSKGLSVHAFTQLEYQIDGEYREFKCVLGVDATVGGSEGPTLVKIEADNKELFSGPVKRDEEPRELKFNIKDVQKIRITVSSGELLDLGKHVNLADAKISK